MDDAPDDDSPEARWERRAETPLAVASLVFLAAYAVRVSRSTDHRTRASGPSGTPCGGPATLATVGYGDVVPVTPVGRLIAVGMMAIGLALLGAVTGTFASWLLQVFSREDDDRPPGG